jgi:hypothetical protein
MLKEVGRVKVIRSIGDPAAPINSAGRKVSSPLKDE